METFGQRRGPVGRPAHNKAALSSGRLFVLLVRRDGFHEHVDQTLAVHVVRLSRIVAGNAMPQGGFDHGLHVASIVNFVDPEVIVFGGGVVEAVGDRFLDPIRVVARQYYIQQADADQVRIVSAELGDYAGVLGAAVLARQKHRATGDIHGT